MLQKFLLLLQINFSTALKVAPSSTNRITDVTKPVFHRQGAPAAPGFGQVVRDAGSARDGDPAPDDHPLRGLHPDLGAAPQRGGKGRRHMSLGDAAQ